MSKNSDDKKFNETLRELLETPPKPHTDKKVDDSAQSTKKKSGQGRSAKNNPDRTMKK
jgi:hypothetical protein